MARVLLFTIRLVLVCSILCSFVVHIFNSSHLVLAAENKSFNEKFGINNITPGGIALAGEVTVDMIRGAGTRYGQARDIGVSWNRLVLWWQDVEQYNGFYNQNGLFWDQYPRCSDEHPDGVLPAGHEDITWDWELYDARLEEYFGEGVKNLVVLQGAPSCRQIEPNVSGAPLGLNEDIFVDENGNPTDLINNARDGESGINPNNPWAFFVFRAVDRYGDEVEYWQVWNEPNGIYWDENRTPFEDFARLVEVTYFAAQHTGKEVHLVMPGLEDYMPGDALNGSTVDLLTALRESSDLAPRYLDYFSVFATHDYNWPWRAIQFPDLVQAETDSSRPFWITEFGADEHFEEDAGDRELTRASVIMQTLVYLLAEGKNHNIKRFFQFQLDNSTKDTGLLDSSGNPRLAYKALLQVDKYLGNAWPVPSGSYGRVLWDPTPESYDDVDHQEVNFASNEYELITVLWSTELAQEDEIEICVPALYSDRQAELVWQQDDEPEPTQTITPTEKTEGEYCYPVALPRAVNDKVGGKTAILLQGKREAPPPEPCDTGEGFENGIACGLQLIRDTLWRQLGIDVTIPENDPPTPGMLFTAGQQSLPLGGAQDVISATATHGAAPLAASLLTSHTVFYGGLDVAWTTDAWASAQFATLSIPQAQLYDEQDTLVATGVIQARPANGRSAIALALGDTLTYTVSGAGTASFYAPALSGLGIGGNWLTYTAQINSASLYGVGLRGAIVSVDGQEYTGTLALVTTDTLTLQGQGHTLTPNFSDRATVQVSDSAVHIGSASLLAGSLPYGVADGFALSGYTGTLTITEHTPDLDLVELEGTFTRDLALTLDPAVSSITPVEASVFQTEIHSNRDDTYTVTVAPPWGWQAQINPGGQITITPPLDAHPGDYPIHVRAQSVSSANVLFSTAVHTVTTVSYNGMQLVVTPDPLTTVSWGPILSDSSIATINNGQAQVPGAAYLATITNTSSTAHTFAVEVVPDSFPAEWIILGGAGRTTATELTLAAGSVGHLSIYVSPENLETLPLAGTTYPFAVHADTTDGSGLSETDSAVFTMPAVPFNYLEAGPPLVLAAPGTPATFDVRLSNVGNVSGTFDVHLGGVPWYLSVPYSITLDVGKKDARTISFTPLGATPGDEETILVQSPAPDSPYVQTDYVGVHIVGPCTYKTSQAAQAAESLNDSQLAAALENLTFQLSRWERDPDNQALRDRTIAALNGIIVRLQRASYPLVDVGGLESLAAAPTIAGFCAPMADLADHLTGIAARDVALDVTPGVQATLPGIPVSYTIRLSAHGSLTTTYDVSIDDLPVDTQFAIRHSQFILTPGESVTTSLVVTPAEGGVYPFTVAATAQQDPLFERRQTAALRVVGDWFQIIAARANPAYVEMGDNTTNLSAAIANTANLYWPAPADVQILAPDGTPMHTRTVPITLTPSLTWEYYDLGSLNVSGWPTGVYTISVRLPTPTGETWEEGLLGVGQAVQASHAVSPTLVPPGTVTPTIIITTELGSLEFGQARIWDTESGKVTLLPSPLVPGGQEHATRPPGLAAPLYQIEPETTLVNTLIDAGTWQPVANASGSLRVYQPSGYGIIEWQDFATDGNGVFTLTFDTAISQTVRLHYYDLDGYADQYYERKRDLAEADLVTLQHGDNALTTRLDPTTRLVNTLLDDRTGLPVANTSGSLRVYQASGYGILESVSFETDAAGVYTATFDTLISQTVRLHYYDLDGYADQYYERKRELGDADPLPLQSGDNTLTTRLSPATRLVNTLLDDDTGRPVANESGSLRVYQPSGYGTLETVSFETDAAGVYTATFDTLISQTVRLHYYDVGGHLDQYYDRKLALAEADPLPLQSGGNALTTYLLPGTRLVNTLLDARTGRPISYTWGTVTVYEEMGAGVIDSRDFGTDAAGVYTATFGLAISQTVRLGYQVDGYPPQYHQLRFSLEEADPVPFQDDTNSLVTPLSAYVPRLSPDTATAFSPPGRPVVHRLSLQNGGSLSDTFSLTLAGQTWPVAAPTTVGPLAPGTSVDLEVVVTVPPTAAVGDSDAVTLTVASTGDPNLTDTSVLTTTAANALLQMCIALDGSGSIGGDEFSLMKDGLANAIRDESVTPQNGSVEISIVQYGADLAQVEVHPTVILGAAAEEVAGQIEAIEQIGQSTPTDLGIDLCTVLMTNSGQFATAGTQVIDLPTDGAPNDKPAAVTARENAVAAGVDEVNAEAIDASTYAIDFLRDQLVYPQPGYDAPPFIPGRGGFVIQVSDFGQFAEAMRQKLQFVVDTSTYLVRVEHSLLVTGVIPLTGTAAPLPLYTLAGDEESQVVWQYVLAPDQPLATATFQARLPQMEPGEVRQVANGTLVRYTGTGGAGEVRLGPLYVSAAHLVAVAPLNQSVGVGGLGHYEVTLFNPTGVGQTYDLSVVGLPAGLAFNLPPTATLGAGQVLTVPLTVAAGAEASFDALPATFDFGVVAATAYGGSDAAQATLSVTPPAFALSISPDWQAAGNGESVTYTLTITNLEGIAHTYSLDVSGLSGNEISLPAEVQVGAGESLTLVMPVTVYAPRGLYPFDVSASLDVPPTTRYASAVLAVSSERGVAAGLTPSIIRAGQNSPAAFTLAVTNTGSLADAYTLTLSLPDGWSGGFRAPDSNLPSPISNLHLTPYVFNAANQQLIVTPAGGTPQGTYSITATIASASDPNASAQAVGYVQVSNYGVTVEIDPATTTMDPRGSQTWDVTVTNTGSEPDTFHLTAGGVISLSLSEEGDGTAQFSVNPVSLAAGASTVVQLTAHDLDFALAQTYPFVVEARSQADPDVAGYDTAEVTFLGFEQVAVTVAPITVTLTDTTTAQYLVFITNTGNLDTDYALSASAAPPGPDLALEMDDIYVPAHLVAGLLLTAQGHQPGTFTFTVQATSTTGLAAGAGSATLVIQESVFAHQPEAADDVVATFEDTPAVVDVLANDSDPDGDPLTVISMTQPFSGTAVIGPDDTVIYTPTANWYGTDAFSYTIGDGHGGTDDATVTVSVAPVNDPPLAVDDSATTAEDTPVTVGVLANDYDVDGDPLTVVSATLPSSGVVAVNPDGTVTYTPTANFYGTDHFTYTVGDGHGGTNGATVTVNVIPVNNPPVAVNDDAATVEDTPVAVDVLANDSDPDGDPLTVISMTQPFSGTAVIGPDDTVIYTPTADWYGTDAFSYTISDGHGGTDDATVTVSIAPVNDPPLAVDDSAITAEDSPVTMDVLANDSDVDGDSLTVISTTQPLSGTATVNLDNTVTYTPTTDFYGTDSFTYTANDGHGGTDDATVTVNVIPINDPPAAMDDDAGTAEDTPVTVNVLANDYDPDEDPLAVISITQPLSGTAAVSPDDTVTYTPTADWYGTDAFNYTIGDGNGGTDSATVTVDVTPVNDPPVAVDDDAATLEDAPVAVNVLANDYDVDGDPLMVISLTQPFNGLVAVGPYSTLTYTPTTNWYGTDSFSYTVGDDNGGAGTAMVTVSVTPVNDPPAAVGDWITTTEDSAVAVEVLANDYDVDGDPLTVVSITQPLSGVAAINLDDTVTYTPTNDFYGTDSFTYAISDGQGGTDSAAVTVTVAPVNDAPVAVDDEALTAEDTPVTMDVLANDSDVDGDPLTVISATRPLSGVVAVNLDGTVTYTPTTDWHGVDAFAYNISDGHGGVDSATVTVTVSPVNDPPVAADDYVTTTGGLSVTVDALANDYDVDGDVLTVISVTRPLSGTAGVNPDRTITYTPTAGLYGTDSFTYTISDGQGGLDVAIVRVVVITDTDCELYPIALHVDTLAGVEVGEEMEDIYNGDGPGNFGWLSWTGDQGVPTLAHSLTPPGDSDTYANPDDPEDHHLSVDDWVRGRPGVGNAKTVRNALDALMPLTITLPVWDVADGQGANLRYHVVGFARVQITDYRLPGQNRVSAIFWGMTTCPEPGASAMSIGREVCEGNFWTCDLLMCRNVIGQNMSRFNGKEWPMR